MFNFFKKKAEKKEVEELKGAVQTGFNNVKQDFGKTSEWIKHLNSKDEGILEYIHSILDEISSMKDEIENLKNMVSVLDNKRVFKQGPTVFNKQTVSKGVLNSVQTGVQTTYLDKLSTTERAIIFILLNSDMKLSYADISAMLGKRKSTVRGQINSIKRKSENLIREQISENNKKRVFIPENMKKILLKRGKVRVKSEKKKKKGQKKSEN